MTPLRRFGQDEMQTDVTTPAQPALGDEAPAARENGRRTRWIIIAVLALGWVAGVLWRLWLGHPIGSPVAHADEDSYLNAARAIAGGPTGFSSETPLFRRVGYSLFISPAFSSGLDFATSYRVVQVLNAVANAALLPLAYVLGRRMFRLGPWQAVAAAFVAATLPATLFWSLIAMTDSIMALLLTGWLLAIHWWLGAPARKWPAVSAGLMTGLLYMVHIRGTIITVVYLGLLALLVLRRHVRLGSAALSAVPLLALIVLNQGIIAWLGDRVRLRGDIVGQSTIQVLTSPDRLQILFAAAGANLWYLCVITLGLAGIAWSITAAEVFRPRRDVAFRWTAGVALVTTLAVIFGSALILAGILTNNDAIYTRYVQMFVPFFFLFGFAELLKADVRTSLKAAVLPVLVIAGGGALLAFRLYWVHRNGNHLAYGVFGGPDLMTITAGWSRFRPLVATAIGLAGLVALIAATRRRRLAIPVLVVLVLANIGTMALMRDRVITKIGAASTLTMHLRDVGVTEKDHVAMTTGLPGGLYFSLYHEVTWMEVNLARTPPKDITIMLTPYQVPGKDFDGAPWGFTRIAADEGQHWAVWRRQ